MPPETLWLTYNDRLAWHNRLALLPPAYQDVYFRPEYVRLYAATDEEACCFVHQDGDNLFLYPFLLREIPSVPGWFDIASAYGYGGPAANTTDLGFLRQARHRFEEEAAQRNVVAELIKFHPLLANDALIAPFFNGAIVPMCSTVYADINGDRKQRWSKVYTHANRKNINKAKRNGLYVEFRNDDDAWHAFFRLYTATMQANRASSFYFFDAAYFNRLQEQLANAAILACCQQKERIVSALLVLYGPTMAHCHLLGTDRSVMPLGVNNLLHHEVIRWCEQKNIGRLHLGGGRTDAPDDSLLRFKKNFSQRQTSLVVGEQVFQPTIYTELKTDWQRRHGTPPPPNRLLFYRTP